MFCLLPSSPSCSSLGDGREGVPQVLVAMAMGLDNLKRNLMARPRRMRNLIPTRIHILRLVLRLSRRHFLCFRMRTLRLLERRIGEQDGGL